MGLPKQEIFPGSLESACARELQNLINNKSLTRLWAKDTSLWPSQRNQSESLKANLRWLDLHERLAPLMARMTMRAAMIEPAGFENVVFITLGDSNLAARSVLRLPGARLGKNTFLLDSIDPDFIRAFDQKLQLDKTLFIFVSKTGKQIETHSLLLYFFERLKSAGIESPKDHFVTLTEESSYLDEISAQYDFQDSFLDPPGIHGRFSSLIHFNFFLAALLRIDQKELLALTIAMRDACGPSTASQANPALSLASFLAASEIEGVDRLVFFTSDLLKPVARRMGYLVGASTCRNRHGIIPIFGSPSFKLAMLQKGCAAVILKMAGESQAELTIRCNELHDADVPLVSIELNSPQELAAELFKWEIATALACSQFEVNPFNDPDLRACKIRSVQILEQLITKGQFAAPTPRLRDGSLELYVEGETRRQISNLSLGEALRTFFSLCHPQGYIAMIPFLNFGEVEKKSLRRIRDLIEFLLGLPVLVTSGARHIHSIVQAHLGGPPKGIFLLLTATPTQDLAIPGADYTFGQIQLALARGEFESLGNRRTPAIRLHLTDGTQTGLIHLESILNGALGRNRFSAA
jgi:transaldolase / glucose-6-phosphate isomerase